MWLPEEDGGLLRHPYGPARKKFPGEKFSPPILEPWAVGGEGGGSESRRRATYATRAPLSSPPPPLRLQKRWNKRIATLRSPRLSRLDFEGGKRPKLECEWGRGRGALHHSENDSLRLEIARRRRRKGREGKKGNRKGHLFEDKRLDPFQPENALVAATRPRLARRTS